jgi:hypothetical protein
VCLIFTRCYKEYPVNEQTFSTKYREKIQQIIVKCITPGSRIPQIPFVFGLDLLPTQSVVIFNLKYKIIKTETKDKVKIKLGMW